MIECFFSFLCVKCKVMARDRQLGRGIALIAGAGLLWGGMGCAVQYLFQHQSGFHPLDVVALRQLGAGVLFVSVALLFEREKMFNVFRDAKLLANVAFSGALIFVTHYAFFESVYYSNAGTGAVFLTTVPLFAALWLALKGRQSMGLLEVFCFLVAVLGVGLIVTDGDWETLQFSPLAVIWGMVSAVLAAVYSIQPIPAIRQAGVVPVVAWGMLIGGLCGLVVGNPLGMPVTWDAPSIGCFAFIVLFGTVAAFGMYMEGLKTVSPVIAGLLNCIEPLSAFLFCIALLGERFGHWQLLGIALLLGNVILLALAKARR